MTMRKIVSAAAVLAALAAPTLVSTKAQAQFLAPYPVVVWLPPVFIMGSAASLIINSVVTYQTECRELTNTEAYTNILLPGVGMVYNVANSKTNKCASAKPVRTKG